MASRTAVGAYRALIRAQRDLFVNDATNLATARAETRTAFMANAKAKPEDIPALIDDAHETALFIRSNVAQAELNERGHYGRQTPQFAILNFQPLSDRCAHSSLSCLFLAVVAALNVQPQHMHPDTGVPPPMPCKEDFNR